MKLNFPSRLSVLSLILALGLISLDFAQDQRTLPARKKRVFTNEDLAKYGERFGADSTSSAARSNTESNPNEGQPGASTGNQNPQSKLDKSDWAGKLKEANDVLAKAKEVELKNVANLSKFQKKLSEARTDFEKQTAQWQVEDTEKNLARAHETRKKAETDKSTLLEEALKNGFKEEDLAAEESVPASPK